MDCGLGQRRISSDLALVEHLSAAQRQSYHHPLKVREGFDTRQGGKVCWRRVLLPTWRAPVRTTTRCAVVASSSNELSQRGL